jgi:hypothetical protein
MQFNSKQGSSFPSFYIQTRLLCTSSRFTLNIQRTARYIIIFLNVSEFKVPTQFPLQPSIIKQAIIHAIQFQPRLFFSLFSAFGSIPTTALLSAFIQFNSNQGSFVSLDLHSNTAPPHFSRFTRNIQRMLAT